MTHCKQEMRERTTSFSINEKRPDAWDYLEIWCPLVRKAYYGKCKHYKKCYYKNYKMDNIKQIMKEFSICVDDPDVDRSQIECSRERIAQLIALASQQARQERDKEIEELKDEIRGLVEELAGEDI